MARTFRKIWSDANDGREEGMLPVSSTIGWDGGPPNLFGLIKYGPLSGEKTMVYSTADPNASLPDPNDKLDFVQVVSDVVSAHWRTDEAGLTPN